MKLLKRSAGEEHETIPEQIKLEIRMYSVKRTGLNKLRKRERGRVEKKACIMRNIFMDNSGNQRKNRGENWRS